MVSEWKDRSKDRLTEEWRWKVRQKGERTERLVGKWRMSRWVKGRINVKFPQRWLPD